MRYITFIAVLSTLPAALCSGDEISVVLTPSSREICVNDPLIVKVSLLNRKAANLVLNKNFTSGHDSIHFEVRGPNESAFTQVLAVSHGVNAGVGDVAVTVAPGEEYVSYEILLLSDRQFIFSATGEYLVRARLHGLRDANATSSAIAVRVAETGKRRNAKQKAAELMMRAITYGGISYSVDSEILASARKDLEDGRLSHDLNWLRLIADVRDATSDRERAQAQEALGNQKSAADPVTREFMSVVLARQYVQLNRLRAAEQELARLENRSWHKESLQRWIAEKRSEAGKPPL